MLPLALANGSFECSIDRIWCEVYAYNRPDISTETVGKIIGEFERVKMLFRWVADDEKVWGFWIGMKKDGLLPPKKHVKEKRYKVGKVPPKELLTRFINNEIQTGITSSAYPDTLQSSPARFGVGFGFGEGVGVGVVEGSSPPLKSLREQEQ